ncbi:MAG TPA: hypothetical protein VF857_03170 [Spirochaetota bacterium]
MYWTAAFVQALSPEEIEVTMEINNTSKESGLQWYHYVAVFFAGLFLTNAIPHFVNGISGNPFPSPFAHPAGKGLSSPLVNVLWGLLNMLIGYLLFRFSRMTAKNKLSMIIFFTGVILISIMSSIAFMDKMK